MYILHLPALTLHPSSPSQSPPHRSITSVDFRSRLGRSQAIPPKQTRQRYNGGPDELADVLKAHITSPNSLGKYRGAE
eukprot:12148352-Alexandrium_andersonii.AAC.1